MHSHKTNETRDRLRSRLNQRKEKFKGNGVLGSTKAPAKPLATTSKVVMNSNKKLEKPPLAPVASIPGQSTIPRTFSEPAMADESKGHASLPRSLAASKAENGELHESIFSISTCSINSLMMKDDVTDSRDIDDLLNYILGNKNIDKVALAQKKAAKKARQRQKREQERLRLEQEEKRKAEQRAREEKRKEAERLKAEALAKEMAEKAARKKAQNEAKMQREREKKAAAAAAAAANNKKSKNDKKKQKPKQDKERLLEETIPAMVTIKRVIENDNAPPTVTITLKGSTPDQDKLLYTLVNGYNKKKEQPKIIENTQETSKNKKKNKSQPAPAKTPEPAPSNNKNKKKKKEVKFEEITKEVNVKLAIDKPKPPKPITVVENTKKKPEEKKKQPVFTEVVRPKPKPTPVEKSKVVKPPPATENCKKPERDVKPKDVGFNLPMLRLPPGITITKVDGPVANRNKPTPPPPPPPTHQPAHTYTAPSHYHSSRVPMSKSGVIVVDTEKLIQQSANLLSNKKRKKKNKKEKAEELKNSMNGTNTSATPMITLKNPIFHNLQTTIANKTIETKPAEVKVSEQAAIFKNDNGMVTIRSPRLQQSISNGSPMPSLLTDLKPVIGPEVNTCHSSLSDNSNSRISSLNAQEILSGLPGIEITKVDKNAKAENDLKKSCQTADVSIIPTSNGNINEKFSFDRDDWQFGKNRMCCC